MALDLVRAQVLFSTGGTNQRCIPYKRQEPSTDFTSWQPKAYQDQNYLVEGIAILLPTLCFESVMSPPSLFLTGATAYIRGAFLTL